MKFHAFHGVMEEERIIGRTFLADLSYAIDTAAAETDCIEDTVSYADLYDLVNEVMMQPSKLIENVAWRVMKAIQSRFPQIPEITVRISKLNPPVNGIAGKATATIHFFDNKP